MVSSVFQGQHPKHWLCFLFFCRPSFLISQHCCRLSVCSKLQRPAFSILLCSRNQTVRKKQQCLHAAPVSPRIWGNEGDFLTWIWLRPTESLRGGDGQTVPTKESTFHFPDGTYCRHYSGRWLHFFLLIPHVISLTWVFIPYRQVANNVTDPAVTPTPKSLSVWLSLSTFYDSKLLNFILFSRVENLFLR